MTIYAIDFDGTIVEEKFPEIGALKPEAAEFIRHIRQNGDKWTGGQGQSWKTPGSDPIVSVG